MRYCTLPDLQLAIPLRTLTQLTNDDPCATEPDMAVVDEAVDQAEELIDGYLRGRYTLPLSPVPTIVKQFTISLARYWIYARRPEGADIPDAVTRGHKDALYGLERIQLGKLDLGNRITGVDTPESGEIRVRAQSRRFSNSFLDKY